MGAAHFFVGMGAGIAILTIPVLSMTTGFDVPQRVIAWIDSPGPRFAPLGNDNTAIARPRSGYTAGDPTPGAVAAPPTVAPLAAPTQTPVPAYQIAAVPQNMPAGSLRTGVVRGNGAPIYVRRVAGVVSPNDPVVADGSPVLVSAGGALQVAGDTWRAVRGLNGIAGWVPSSQVAVDGEAPPPAPVAVPAQPNTAQAQLGAPQPNQPNPPNQLQPQLQAPSQPPIPAQTQAQAQAQQPIFVGGFQPGPSTTAQNGTSAAPNGGTSMAPPGTANANAARARIANTDGLGVVLRNSPRDADRSTRGLMDGAGVTVVEVSGADWVHVRADNGQEGWIPARYIAQ
jgi:SH3-like domain-containing protein